MSHLTKSVPALAVALLLLSGSSASATSNPIPGVDIIVRKCPGGIIKKPTTGKDGKFVFDKAPAGKCTVELDLEKAKAVAGTTKATIRVVKSMVKGVEVHEVIVIFDKNAKEEFKPVEIELGEKGGRITGTITHEVPAKTDKK
jgi:hypothetical protein